ncbi:hypothetical protein H4R19_006506 [Coemansia spiralis]|nr:hypothetical protein H4R19_006506 [Coemansia spiralis]
MAGATAITHMDEFVDQLLREPRVCFVALPALTRRIVLEDSGQLPPRLSPLDDDSDSDSDASSNT